MWMITGSENYCSWNERCEQSPVQQMLSLYKQMVDREESLLFGDIRKPRGYLQLGFELSCVWPETSLVTLTWEVKTH